MYFPFYLGKHSAFQLYVASDAFPFIDSLAYDRRLELKIIEIFLRDAIRFQALRYVLIGFH